jgi:hypothetical protein
MAQLSIRSAMRSRRSGGCARHVRNAGRAASSNSRRPLLCGPGDRRDLRRVRNSCRTDSRHPGSGAMASILYVVSLAVFCVLFLWIAIRRRQWLRSAMGTVADTKPATDRPAEPFCGPRPGGRRLLVASSLGPRL